MATWMPDPTFYPSPRMAVKAPPEQHAYVAEFDPGRKRPDRLAVVDVNPRSSTYAQIVGRTALPGSGDELHHFGWNACSSCLCPNAPHPHVERRYLIGPGCAPRASTCSTPSPTRATSPGPHDRGQGGSGQAGYSRPHTVHCGPDGIYVTALANAEGKAPGGVFVLDHETFDVLGGWEVDRGPQHFGYDAWWHLGHDTM